MTRVPDAGSRQPRLRRRKPTPAAPDVAGRVLVVDAEGRGYRDDGIPSLVELAVVEIIDGRLMGGDFHTRLDPGAPINPYAQRVHRLGPKDLRGAPRFADVAAAFLAFLRDDPIVAHGAASDLALINHDLVVAGLEPLAPGRLCCTQRMAKRLLGEDMGRDALCDALGRARWARDAGHGALLDAQLTASCFLALARRPGCRAVQGVWVRKRG